MSLPSSYYKEERVIGEENWQVRRYSSIVECVEYSGEVKWRVQIWDSGREPFITQYFNSPERAESFVARVRKENSNG